MGWAKLLWNLNNGDIFGVQDELKQIREKRQKRKREFDAEFYRLQEKRKLQRDLKSE